MFSRLDRNYGDVSELQQLAVLALQRSSYLTSSSMESAPIPQRLVESWLVLCRTVGVHCPLRGKHSVPAVSRSTSIVAYSALARRLAKSLHGSCRCSRDHCGHAPPIPAPFAHLHHDFSRLHQDRKTRSIARADYYSLDCRRIVEGRPGERGEIEQV